MDTSIIVYSLIYKWLWHRTVPIMALYISYSASIYNEPRKVTESSTVCRLPLVLPKWKLYSSKPLSIYHTVVQIYKITNTMYHSTKNLQYTTSLNFSVSTIKTVLKTRKVRGAVAHCQFHWQALSRCRQSCDQLQFSPVPRNEFMQFLY